MNPAIISAIITTLGNSATALFTRFFPAQGSTQTIKADTTIERVYDKLRPELTSNCIRVLLALEHGQNPTRTELRETVFPTLTFSNHQLRQTFDGEFHYRLKTMCALGIILDIGGGREYAITKLGFGFLSTARKRGHYPDAL
ncbi:MAG TPA: hypothetical protein VK557_00180 [Pyrinomonadaceae bacterium]|nr:hypothetical protein [Pyrinomonadaceae bacterium]